MYQALYRKWRPKIFDDVIGQEHITETLKTQVRTGHLSHAYIFIGTRGTGKTTCARILAKAVNCENPINGNPCNKCRYCTGIDDGSILDIVELDAASNTGVDNVRDLREEAIFSPAAAKKRVYIIDEVHMLSLAAFNALLKIIEEPPPHLMFILATTELQKVPATILSRCQRHSFRRIPAERLSEYLQVIASRENLVLEHEAAQQIGRLAEGGVRDALSILDQCSGRGRITVETVFETMGLAGNRNLVLLLDRVLQHDSEEALRLFQKIWLDGKEPSAFLGEMNGLIRDIMIVKAAPSGAEELISGNYERDVLNSFAARMTKEEILFSADTIQNALSRMRQTRSPRIAAELCLVSLCDDRTAETVLSLRARIARLEQAVQSGVDIKHIHKELTAELKPDAERPELSAPMPLQNKDEKINMEDSRNENLHPSNSVQQEEEQKDIAEADTEQIKKVLEKAKQKLPIDVRISVDDPARVRFSLNDNEVLIEVFQSFLLERLKKPETRDVFANAAREVLGHAVNVRITELQQGQRMMRDINELRQFREVKFIS